MECQKSKVHKHTKTLIKRYPTLTAKFQWLNLDICGPFPEIPGYQYLLTIYDRYTRWTTAIPIPNITFETVAKAFMHSWVSTYGVPAYISTDSARIFCGVIWTKLTQLLGCKSIRTSPRRPESNSGIERYHRSLKGAIMTHLNNRS